MRLSHTLKPEHVFLDRVAASRDELLATVARRLASGGALPDATAAAELLGERERLRRPEVAS